jgi:hypothetical protein
MHVKEAIAGVAFVGCRCRLVLSAAPNRDPGVAVAMVVAALVVIVAVFALARWNRNESAGDGLRSLSRITGRQFAGRSLAATPRASAVAPGAADTARDALICSAPPRCR